MEPCRIQLSRKRGFNLQRESMAINGLPAIKVDRSTKWGNPFVIGGHVDMKQARRWGWKIRNPKRSFPNATEAREMFACALALDGASLWLVKRELKGRNLACWCELSKPGEPDVCHATVLLELAKEQP